MKWRVVCYLILFTPAITVNSSFSQEYRYPPPDQNSVYKNLQIATELVEKNLEDQALKYLDFCLYKRPNEKNALFIRARIYNNKKMYLKALTDYNAFLSLEPENREALYSRGLVRYQMGQYERALEDFMKLRDVPGNQETKSVFYKTDASGNMAVGVATISSMKADILNHMGLCYFQLGQYQKAIDAFSEGISISPSSDLYVNRALAWEKTGNISKAIDDYEFVTENYPGNEMAAWNLLALKQKAGSQNLRLNELNQFIEQYPDMANGYAARGMFYYEKEDFLAASRDMRKAVTLEADNEDYLFNLGLCLIKINKPDSAEVIFEKLTAMDHTHAGAWFNLGNIRYGYAAYNEAIACYTIALQHQPGQAQALYNRALAYYQEKKLKEACSDMKMVQKLDPGLGKVRSFLKKHCIE